MRILVVHPIMSLLGGGERLCCATIRALLADGNEITLLSGEFDPKVVEEFFGYPRLFDKVTLRLYPVPKKPQVMGSTPSLIHNTSREEELLNGAMKSTVSGFDILFSTQDPGYIPDVSLPVIQWGYFPRMFPQYSSSSMAKFLRSLPIRFYYNRKVSRVGLVLAISLYSKYHLDKEWKRPSALLYPACNMLAAGEKRDLIVTVARASPAKKLELFWKLASLRPQYEFTMLLTRDPYYAEYTQFLSRLCPSNGKIVLDPPKDLYQQILGESKVYLHLMKGEHFGISVVEAMSAGCVPVVHDSGGPKEIVIDGTGFRWIEESDIPSTLDRAIRASPSPQASVRARDFSVPQFDAKLCSVLDGLKS